MTPTTLPKRANPGKKPPVEQFVFDLRDYCRRNNIDPGVAGLGSLQFAAMVARKLGEDTTFGGWWKWLRAARAAWKAAKGSVA